MSLNRLIVANVDCLAPFLSVVKHLAIREVLFAVVLILLKLSIVPRSNNSLSSTGDVALNKPLSLSLSVKFLTIIGIFLVSSLFKLIFKVVSSLALNILLNLSPYFSLTLLNIESRVSYFSVLISRPFTKSLIALVIGLPLVVLYIEFILS